MPKPKQTPTLPTFGEVVPGEGGRLAGIMRGPVVDGVRQPDYALIVADATDAPAVLLPWGKSDQDVTGATSLTDGPTNTIAMAAAGSPAALHIRKLAIGGHTDWYLPARAELWAARGNVPELFEKEWHWSSTQIGRHYAFYQSFDYGGSGWGDKDLELRCRAFRRVQLYHFPA